MFVSCGIGAAAGGAPAEPTKKAAAPRTTVTVTVTAKPAPAQAAATPSAKPPATTVKLPNVVGKNGAIALDALEQLGITKVELGSADPSATVIVVRANWRITKQEPRPGTRVRTGDDGTLVVLTAMKIR